jgi:glucokinase
MAFIGGIDLGGTQIKAVCLEADSGRVLSRRTEPTRDGELEHGVPVWATAVGRMVAALELEFGRLAAIGLCAPGLAARDGRSIACMPGRMRGIVGFDWTAHLGREGMVPVLNDAHAALVGEVAAGAARGRCEVYLLTLGTGVGGAVYADGRILRGHLGRAGHLGHLCLDPDGPPDVTRTPGSLEDLIGEHTVRERSGGRFGSTRELVAAHGAGDREASRVWLRSIRVLACAVASLNNILDPELVVLGGGITSAGRHLFEPLACELDAIEWRPHGVGVPVVPAELGEWAGAIGAAFRAGEGVQRGPTTAATK